MEKTTLKITVDGTVSYRTLFGADMEVHLHTMNRADVVNSRISVPYPSWLRCLQESLFHLDEVENHPGFDETLPVNIALLLRPGITASLPENEEEFIRVLLDPLSPCMHTEAWLATEVTQTLPVPGEENLTTDIGIQTQWAHEWLP